MEGRKWEIKINLVGESIRQRCKGPKAEESEFGKKDAAGLGLLVMVGTQRPISFANP